MLMIFSQQLMKYPPKRCSLITLHLKVSRWLNFDTCQRLFAEYGFFYAKPLIIGTLAECFAFSIERNSIIPEQLGLPPLGGNQIEGIVIKGTNNEQIPDAQERAIFKKKNRNFTEVNDRSRARQCPMTPPRHRSRNARGPVGPEPAAPPRPPPGGWSRSHPA